MEENALDRIRKVLREDEFPLFSDDDIKFYFDENNKDERETIYQCLIIKSEDSSISISGLSTSDTSSYFKRLAQRYKRNNSGILK